VSRDEEVALSRDEGELLTVRMPRAVVSLPVCPSVKPVGEPDALIGHLRFDGQVMGNGALPEWPKLPRPSSTLPKGVPTLPIDVRSSRWNGPKADVILWAVFDPQRTFGIAYDCRKITVMQ
jgi:hypothetical protein